MSESDAPWFHSHREPFRSAARGLVVRIVLTVFGSITWIAATLLYLAFWPTGFTLVQDIVVFVVSMLVLFGAIAGMWASFGLSHFRRWTGW